VESTGIDSFCKEVEFSWHSIRNSIPLDSTGIQLELVGDMKDLNLTNLNQEECIQLAIDEIHRSVSTSTGLPTLSLRRAHCDFGVPKSTLSSRYNGTHTCQQPHEHERRLTDAQEDVLVQ